MRKKKDETVVRTTVIEAIIVVLVCLVAFLGLVYMKLMPYIGESIAEKQKERQSYSDSDTYYDDSDVIYLDEDGNVLNDNAGKEVTIPTNGTEEKQEAADNSEFHDNTSDNAADTEA